jgi:hypothetical protein
MQTGVNFRLVCYATGEPDRLHCIAKLIRDVSTVPQLFHMQMVRSQNIMLTPRGISLQIYHLNAHIC